MERAARYGIDVRPEFYIEASREQPMRAVITCPRCMVQRIEHPETEIFCNDCIEEVRSEQMDPKTNQPKRVPVDFRYDAINPLFLKMMAKIGSYAAEKYDAWEQYTTARLTGEKSPINHIYEHLRQYQCGETYDHFDGDTRWHLVAVAYNAMMEFFYHTKFGHQPNPLVRATQPRGLTVDAVFPELTYKPKKKAKPRKKR